ncbi:hypothetical protein ABN028_14760 [Actinopolymorpha sp. B17G11]|uniref:hypothetical protein n=1 Tax=Actinopolymorpha sp. B17G11 TaxID=3160861 RepID=UPI0032E44F4E
MNPTRRPIPSGWSLLLGTAAILALPVLFVADHLTVRAPDITDRATVREMIGPPGGIPIALPVELPPGYEPPDFWEHSTDLNGRVDARSVAFFPTAEAREDRQVATVRMCVEADSIGHGPCGFGANPVERHVGNVRVLIWLPDHDPDNRAAWRTVPFTADLNEVRWLR